MDGDERKSVGETSADSLPPEADSVPPDSDMQDRSDTPQAPSIFEADLTEATEVPFNHSPRIVLELPTRMGAYMLLEKVGEGGAGIVYRGLCSETQRAVAVKLIRPEMLASRIAMLRFEKESRLHSEIRHPNVTEHIEFDSFNGLYFIVSEFVEGISLRDICRNFGALPTDFALVIAADLLRALSALHDRSMVHRDVKPENVLAVFDSLNIDDASFMSYQTLKLTDFGLARHIDQSESLAMTRQQATLGTPLYMAPEQQYESRAVDARADVYGVGATLYHLLAGRPPFQADDAMALAELHRSERPVLLSRVDRSIGEALANVVAKSLEKEPGLRYDDAGAMLADIERLIDGRPTSIRPYPVTPETDNPQVKSYRFEWELDASTGRLWPLVSDTDRLNRALGLPLPEFSHRERDGQREMVAEAKFNGMKVRWQEHPFEWIRERQLSVLREFEAGPFTWVTSTVELHPLSGERTRLIHRFQVKPSGILGRLVTKLQFGYLTPRALKKIYQRIERIANDASSAYACHAPYDKPVHLTAEQSRRLDDFADQLALKSGDPKLSQALSDYLRTVDDPAASRIRPGILARELDCPADSALELCMHSVPLGGLKMSWDVICPVCRIAASNVSSIERISSHSSCNFCDLEFEVDFAKSVELVFGVHPDIRNVDIGVYCIGGPFHSPHVIAQNRLTAGQRLDIGAKLETGSYSVGAPQLVRSWNLDVVPSSVQRSAVIELAGDDGAEQELGTGPVSVRVVNHCDTEMVTRLERVSDERDAVTAQRAASHPAFRRLFPDQVVESESSLVEMQTAWILAVWDGDSERTIDEIGDMRMRSYWRKLHKSLIGSQGHNGELVEGSHDHVCIVYQRAKDLFNAIVELETQLIDGPEIPRSRFSVLAYGGEVISGSDSGQSRFYGLAIREVRKAIAANRCETGKLIVGEEQIRADEFAKLIDGLCSSKSPTELKNGFAFFERKPDQT